MAKIEVWALSDDPSKHFWERKRAGEVLGELGSPPLELIEIEGRELRTRIRAVIAEFDGLVAEKEADSGGLSIAEVELGLAINVKGGVQLITKFEAGAEASIKVRLRRRSPD